MRINPVNSRPNFNGSFFVRESQVGQVKKLDAVVRLLDKKAVGVAVPVEGTNRHTEFFIDDQKTEQRLLSRFKKRGLFPKHVKYTAD